MARPRSVTQYVYILPLLIVLFATLALMQCGGAPSRNQVDTPARDAGPSSRGQVDSPASSTQRVPRFVVDVARRERFHRWASDLSKRENRDSMGHTANVPEQIDAIANIVLKWHPHAKTVCEIGMNVGHSAATILTALDAPTDFVAFDGFDGPPVKASEQLKLEFPAVKFEFVSGDSHKTVPLFSEKQKHPGGFRCDIIHIDAGHSKEEALGDIVNIRPIATNTTLVLLDDCGCRGSCKGVNLALHQAIEDGVLIIESVAEYVWSGKGTCVTRYQTKSL